MNEVEERVALAIASAAGMQIADIDLAVVRAAIAALPQGEPVAWRLRYENGEDRYTPWVYVKNKPDEYPDRQVEPLYAAPAQPVSVCAENAHTAPECTCDKCWDAVAASEPVAEAGVRGPVVSVLDDELLVEWPGFLLICMDDEGFGYAVNETGIYRPGKFNEWPAAAQEIKALLASRTPALTSPSNGEAVHS